MKRKRGIGLNNFRKIQCLDCGTNCDLLSDDWKRVICRECLEKWELNEVENESDLKEVEVRSGDDLYGPAIYE